MSLFYRVIRVIRHGAICAQDCVLHALVVWVWPPLLVDILYQRSTRRTNTGRAGFASNAKKTCGLHAPHRWVQPRPSTCLLGAVCSNRPGLKKKETHLGKTPDPHMRELFASALEK